MSQQNELEKAAADFQRRIRLEEIFIPHAQAQRQAFYSQQNGAGEQKLSVRFVHYTSAEAALNMLRSREIWMRNTTCMSDFMEVDHGLGILQRFFAEEGRRQAFFHAMDSVIPGVAQKAIDLFNPHLQGLRFSSHIFSISEHDAKEDQHGRLSMWRAFGGHRAQVALIFRVPWEADANFYRLRLLFSPVSYPSPAEELTPLNQAISNINANAGFLRTQGEVELVNQVFNMLVTIALCSKHQGFNEEREWRAIYCPDVFPSELMKTRVETVGGIPQPIYLIPLNHPEITLLHPENLFEKLMIGPSAYPMAMYKAFVAELTNIGIDKAEERVITSGIPLRSRDS